MELLFQKHDPEKSVIELLEIFEILKKKAIYFVTYTNKVLGLLRTQRTPSNQTEKEEGPLSSYAFMSTTQFTRLLTTYRDDPNPEYEP